MDEWTEILFEIGEMVSLEKGLQFDDRTKIFIGYWILSYIAEIEQMKIIKY